MTHNILIIDDNPDDIFLFTTWLRNQSEDYIFKEVHNIADVPAALSSFSPDCILLDGFLLDGDCFDLLRDIRYLMSNPAPIIVISAYESKPFAEDAKVLGAHEFCNKNDLDAQSLHLTIQRILA